MTNSVRITEPVPGVFVITLDRPTAANAMDTAMGRRLLDLWTELSANSAVRTVILTGAGNIFCAGADLKERDGMSDEAWSSQHRLFEEMIRAQLACPHPVIAAVNGAAIGGGCEMALACDFIWASDTARFALPEAGLGIMPGLGGTQTLARAVGQRRAFEALISAQPLDAAEALRAGMVNRLFNPDELLPATLSFALTVSLKAPLSVRAIKHVVHAGGGRPLFEAMALELEAYNALFATADRREGVAAFNQKRSASFLGR